MIFYLNRNKIGEIGLKFVTPIKWSKTVEKFEIGWKKAWLGIFEREKAVKTVF